MDRRALFIAVLLCALLDLPLISGARLGVQFRIDHEVWVGAQSADGGSDAPFEPFTSPASPLGSGTHVGEARARTSAESVDRIPAADSTAAPLFEIMYTVPANYDTLVQWWQQLETQYPGYLYTWSPNQAYGLGTVPSSTSHPPYDLYFVRLTNESLGFSKPEVFFMGSPHGDEKTGTIGAYWFVHWLLRHAFSEDWNTPYDDWLRWLLDNREVYFSVSHNPDGFDRVRRCDALNRDLNREADHDGPGDQACPSQAPDVFTSVQGKTVARFMDEHQIRVGMDFHGGIRALLYPWGSTHCNVVGVSPVTGRTWSCSPADFYFYDLFAHRMGDYIGDFGLNYSAGVIGPPTGIVGYTAQGTWLDWAYGSDTAANPAESPYVKYGPYRGTGALWITPEISLVKNPPEVQYGGDLTLGWGMDVRRMLLAMIDIAQPYVRWHPSGVSDGFAVEAGEFFDISWQVNGSLVVDGTQLQWSLDPDPINNPQDFAPLHQDFAGQYVGGTGWEAALDGSTRGHLWWERMRAPSTPGTYYFVAKAQVDQRYETVLEPSEYGSESYLRVIKERTWTVWSEDIAGADGLEHMEGRGWWYSPVLRIDVLPDNTPPVITLRWPADGAVIRAGTRLDFDVVDSTLQTTTVAVNGGAPTNLPRPWDVSTTGWADGLHTVRINATDAGGRSSIGDFSFMIDSTPPGITLVAPAEGSLVSAGAALEFDVADVHFASATWTRGGFPANLYAPFDVDTSGWPEGSVTVTVQATDLAGNTGSESFSFLIDASAPTITLRQPANESAIQSGTILDFSIDDLGAASATWDRGGGPTPLSAPWDVDTYGWPEGPVTLVVRATDSFGMTNTATFSFVIDDTAPTVTLQAPLQLVIRPGTTIDFEVIDPNLQLARWSVGTGPMQDLPSPFTVNTTGWVEGDHQVNVWAWDAAGNMALVSFSFAVDGTPPDLSRSGSASVIRPGETVNFLVVDAHPGPVFWQFAGQAEEHGLAPPFFGIDTSGWADGDYEIRVRATDLAGNEASRVWAISIDGTPPVVIFLEPTANTLTRPGVDVRYSVDDLHLAAANVTATSNAATFEFSAEPPFALDTGTWPDGVYSITLRAIDAAGNAATLGLRLTIDGTPPTLGTPELHDSPRLGRSIHVAVRVTDLHGPSAVVLHWRPADGTFADVPMTSDASGGWAAEIPAQSTAGTVEYYVTASDEVGNTAETPVRSVTFTRESQGFVGGTTIFLAAVILIGLAVTALLVLSRARRRSSDRASPPDSGHLRQDRQQQEDDEEPGGESERDERISAPDLEREER